MNVVDPNDINNIYVSRRNLYKDEWDKWIFDAEEAFRDLENRGEEAILEHNMKRLEINYWQIDEEFIEKQVERIEETTLTKIKEFFQLNLELAKRHFEIVKKFEEMKFNVLDSLNITYKLVPINRIGIYTSPKYISTFLHMLALCKAVEIPQENIVVVSYPIKKQIPLEFLASLYITNIKKLILIKGRYAIAALTLGVKDKLQPVDMIIGPASPWVDAAKRYAQMKYGVKIDLPAGPTEIAILTNLEILRSERKKFVALECLTQLEHGPYSQCFLIITMSKMADPQELEKELVNIIQDELRELRFNDAEIKKYLERITVIPVKDLKNGGNVLNKIAPEYAIIISNNKRMSKQTIGCIHNAGTISLNVPSAIIDYSPETCLSPTWGFAKSYSKFNITNLLKVVPIIRTNEISEDFKKLITSIASMEELTLHKASISFFLTEDSI